MIRIILILTFLYLLSTLMACRSGTQLGSPDYVIAADSLYRESFRFLTVDSSRVFSLSDSIELISQSNNYIKGIARAYFLKGYVYDLNDEYDLAVSNYMASLEQSRPLEHYQLSIRSLENIAKIYYFTHNPSRAKEYYEEALELSREQMDSTRIAYYLSNIGRCLEKLTHFKEAQKYYKVAQRSYESLNDLPNMIKVEVYIGNSYYNAGSKSKALYSYNKVLIDGKGLPNESTASGNALNNIGNIYLEEGDHPQAADYFNQALAIAELPANTKNTIYNNLAEIYRHQEEWEKAAEYYSKVADQSSNHLFDRQFTKATKGLYEIYRELGNHDMAYKYGDQLANNMIPLLEVKEKLELHNQQYRLHQAEEKIKALEAKAAASRQWLINVSIISGLAILCLAGLYLSIRHRNKWQQLRKAVDAAYQKQQQAYHEAMKVMQDVKLPDPTSYKLK